MEDRPDAQAPVDAALDCPCGGQVWATSGEPLAPYVLAHSVPPCNGYLASEPSTFLRLVQLHAQRGTLNPEVWGHGLYELELGRRARLAQAASTPTKGRRRRRA